MSGNIEVINPQGPGSTVAPNYTDKTSTANGSQKAKEQSSRCSNGGCGNEVPGQCCEWMAKFDIACQQSLRPYTESCGSCGGSGDKGSGMCQACNGTGLDRSIGGAQSQLVKLVRVDYIAEEQKLKEYILKWGFPSLEDFYSNTATQFSRHWKNYYVKYITKVFASISLDKLNSLYREYGYIASYSNAYLLSDSVPVYMYDGLYYALQSDMQEEFPNEGF